MRAVGIVLSFGRPELGELFTMWCAQTRPIPLFVALDGCAVAVVGPPDSLIRHCVRDDVSHGIGGLRARAVAMARAAYGLTPDDAILILDDDDYYSPHHVARTLDALELSKPFAWTGAARFGVQWRRDQMPPELVEGEGGYGPGPHAAWAMLLRTYDFGDGYRAEDQIEDARLVDRIGWRVPRQHRHLTHVRRQFSADSLSACEYARDVTRRGAATDTIVPTWRPELDALERWALAHEVSP